MIGLLSDPLKRMFFVFKMTLQSLALFGFLLLVGCAQSGSNPNSAPASDVQSQNQPTITGKINGQSFSVRTAFARIVTYDLGTSPKFFEIIMSEDNSNDPCELKPSNFSTARFRVKNALGKTALGAGLKKMQITFDFSNNSSRSSALAVMGFVNITEVNLTESRIKGFLEAKADSNNEIQGSFDLKICE